MALTFNPFGLSEAGYLAAAKPRESTFTFPLENAAPFSLGSGEPVALNNAGSIYACAVATAYPPAVTQELILGVFQYVKYAPSQSTNPPGTFGYWAPGTTTFNGSFAQVGVSVDPNQIYYVQANGPINEGSIGQNYNLDGFNNVDSFTQNSRVYMNNTAAGFSANWAQVKLIGLAPITPAIQVQGGNAWGDPYTIVQVVLNSTVFKYGQYGV